MTSTTKNNNNPDLTSPGEDSDVNFSTTAEIEPVPGLNGVPVRWYDADRTESYTRTTPFQEKHDTSVEFFYKPITLSALAFGLIVLAYVATTQDVLEEGRDKRRVGVYAAIAAFFNVLNDSISRWTVHKTPSCVLACGLGD